MRASKYFPKEMLTSVEDIIFTDAYSTDKVKYCLLHETRKVYYMGASSNIAGMVSKLRSCVRNAEGVLLAHHVQENAKTSNMSHWVIALFKDSLDDHLITKYLPNYERLHKAAAYEVNPVENTKMYLLEHRRFGAQVYISSARPITDSLANSRAKRALSQRTLNYNYNLETMPSALKSAYLCVFHAAEHSSCGEWIIKEIPTTGIEPSAVSRHVLRLNKSFLDLTFRA